MADTPSAFRLKSVHPSYGVNDVDIHPYVEQVRSGGLHALDPSLDPKIRRNILTVFLTEKWWRHAERAEADSPDTFGLPTSDFRLLEEGIPHQVLPEIFRNLKDVTQNHLLVNSILCSFDSDPVVEELKSTKYLDSNSNLRTPYPDRFDAGIENANMMAWESIHQLPYVHWRDFGAELPIPSEQYQEISFRNVSFLRHLAAAHLQVFSAAHSSARSHGAVSPFQHFPAFSLDFLTMTGEASALRMELHPRIVEHIDQFRLNFEQTIATGCPALVAKASNGKDVVTAMYEWIQRIASRVFFPHADKILARTDLSDTLGIATMTEMLLRTVKKANS